MLSLTLRSLAARWPTVVLTVLAVALSTALFLGVEKLRAGARESFAGTLSGTDLVVGGRSGAAQLLLYSVFRIGNATSNVSMESAAWIAAMPQVAWTVPLSLGDSHRGWRVLGTTPDYFRHYRYRGGQTLRLAAGVPLQAGGDLFDAVLGSDAAAALGYRVGDHLVVAHGLGRTSFALHEDTPFRVAGILAPTGTPVDATVHVSLEAIEAIHVDWRSGARKAGAGTPAEALRAMDLKPASVTALLVGLTARRDVFRVQRAINETPREPLLAILPGATLAELWSVLSTAERAMAAVSALVVVTALLGMATMILAGLEARRREMAILRSVGAGPGTVAGLLVLEAALLALAGAALGIVLLHAATLVLQPVLDERFGIAVPIGLPGLRDLAVLVAVGAAGALAGLLPAWRAYRLSLADGMQVRN